MKILSYNVNGIRSAVSKGFIQWLQYTHSDVVCLQEIKATVDQIPVGLFEEIGYYSYWHPAKKKGYSGVAILSKVLPNHVEFGCGIEKYDVEGRVIRADFDRFSLMSVYMPSGSSGDLRQSFKMQWLADFRQYIAQLKRSIPHLIISGDYNICHQAIDIHNPKSNAQSSGFLPEERTWLSQFIQTGFVDTFRLFNQEPHHYTWWSFRAGARNKNLGWRIDYHMASDALKTCLSRSIILPEAKHSDHCPILLEIDLTSQP